MALLSIVKQAFIGKENHALAFFHAFMEESLEDCTIWICFLSKALFDSFFPLPFVKPFAVWSVILAVSVRFVEVPFSLIVAAVFVEHNSEALPTVLDPVSDVVESFSFVDHDS